MTYTFDDAIKHWNRESANGPLVPGIVASPLRNVPQQEYDRVKFMNRLFYSIIEQLREEYAPTVEMTSGEKATVLAEQSVSLSWLLTDSASFDALYWGNRSERDIAQAWLHPETIKVVEE